MSEAVQIALIVTAGPTLLGAVTAVLSFLNRRKIDDVHKSTNSRLDQLLAAAKVASHAEGMADQRNLDRDKGTK